MGQNNIQAFRTTVYSCYKHHGRSFAWRNTTDPYAILVSEIMLQQTQTARVEQVFPKWMDAFSNFDTLAHASIKKILGVWQGMGYNRRALALKACAQKTIEEFGGVLPDNPEILVTFPHIGPNTAGSITAFAFDKPAVFIETNIRRVFLHVFFPNKIGVPDREILPLIEQTLDRKHPREWYFALMDYGAYLAKHTVNPNRRSKHYTKQSRFEGSNRQIRGAILKALHASDGLSVKELSDRLGSAFDHAHAAAVKKNLSDLKNEGFIANKNGYVTLAS